MLLLAQKKQIMLSMGFEPSTYSKMVTDSLNSVTTSKLFGTYIQYPVTNGVFFY